jgi:carbamoyl-phosphate synthase large subunit
LPFANSFAPGETGDGAALAEFCRQAGYPLIAKPRQGFASRGVFFVRNDKDAAAMAQPDYLFQEYLGDAGRLEPYFASLGGPVPLVTQVPYTDYYSSWTMVAPDGALSPILITRQTFSHGVSVALRRTADADVHAIAVAYARAFHGEGGSGPLNIGYRRDRHGVWSVQEINLRNTGGTLSRFLLGLDELYQVIRVFAPGFPFPEMCPAGEAANVARKLYIAHALYDTAIETLGRTGRWTASGAAD